jgi:hypothetical protein
LLRYPSSITQPSVATNGVTRAQSSAAVASVQPGPRLSASSSTNGTPSRAARARPTVVFPHPLAEAITATFLIPAPVSTGAGQSSLAVSCSSPSGPTL